MVMLRLHSSDHRVENAKESERNSNSLTCLDILASFTSPLALTTTSVHDVDSSKSSNALTALSTFSEAVFSVIIIGIPIQNAECSVLYQLVGYNSLLCEFAMCIWYIFGKYSSKCKGGDVKALTGDFIQHFLRGAGDGLLQAKLLVVGILVEAGISQQQILDLPERRLRSLGLTFHGCHGVGHGVGHEAQAVVSVK